MKALYARVSTKDKGQDVENQLAQMAFSDGLAGAAPYVSARTCPPRKPALSLAGPYPGQPGSPAFSENTCGRHKTSALSPAWPC